MSNTERKSGKPTGRNVKKRTAPDGRQMVTTAEPKAAPKKTSRPQPFSDGAVIHILTANPHRPGTKNAALFGIYKDGMTVAQAREAGATFFDMRWYADRQHIRVDEPAEKPEDAPKPTAPATRPAKSRSKAARARSAAVARESVALNV